MVDSISHITFVVRDIEKTARLLKSVFKAEEVYDSGGKNFSLSREKFFMVGGVWIAVMEGEPLSESSYNHVAFKVPDSEFDEYTSRINRLALEVRPGRRRIEGEGRSIYFYDYDNHLFELHTGTLKERLRHYGARSPGAVHDKDDLMRIPGVGKSIAGDLIDLGITRVSQLRRRSPEKLYERLCALRGVHIDRCVLYVFRCAVYFASEENPDPELLKWWSWKDKAPGRKPGRSAKV